jgi:hypothetical protein
MISTCEQRAPGRGDREGEGQRESGSEGEEESNRESKADTNKGARTTSIRKGRREDKAYMSFRRSARTSRCQRCRRVSSSRTSQVETRKASMLFSMRSYFVWSGSACIERVFSDPGAQRNHLAENVVTSRHRKKRGKKESSDGKRPRPDVDLTSAPLAGSSSHTNAFDSIRSEQSRLPSPHDGP